VTGRLRSALLWGAVGLFSYLVAVQSYLLLGGRVPLSPLETGTVAGAVGAVVATVSYVVEPRLLQIGRR
jgi:DNA-directed RNA polymerase specialized sigma54-like protein